MMFNQALERGAFGLLVGGIIAIIAVVVDRGIEEVALPAAVHAGICGAGALAGGLLGVARTPRPVDIAATLDRRLSLKDRLGTAAAIENGAVPPSEFAPLVEQDAARVAQRIDPRSAAPLQLSGTWVAAAVLVAALVAAVLYLPDFARASTGGAPLTSEEVAALQSSREGAASALEQAVDQLRQAPTKPASEDDLAALDELAAQLGRDDVSPEEFAAARDAAAERLDDVAARSAAQAERERQVLEELDRRFEGLGHRDAASEPNAAAELSKALADGDYQEAVEKVDELAQALDGLTPEQRTAAAEELRRLREQIGRSSEESSRDAAAREASLRETLREQGLDEEAIDRVMSDASDEGQSDEPPFQPLDQTTGADNAMANSDEPPREERPPSDPRDLAERLQKEGIEPEQAQRLSENVAQERERQQAQRQADSVAEDLSRSLEDLADEVEQPDQDRPRDDSDREAADQEPTKPQGAQGEETQQSQEEQRNQEQGADTETESEQSESQREESQQQSGEEQSREEQRQSEDHQGQDQRAQDQRAQEQRAQEQRAQEQRAQEQRAQGQRAEEQKQQEQAQREACPECQSGKPCENHQESGETQSSASRQAEGARAANDQPASGDSNPATDQSSAGDRIKQTLRELNERGESAEQARRQSEDSREAARELAKQITPQERERLAQWAREFERQDQDMLPGNGPPPGSGEPAGRGGGGEDEANALDEEFFEADEELDLREDATDQRTLAQWLADEQPADGEAGETTGGGNPIVAQAQRAAERAVNEGAVPRRYHDFIQRYFGRFRKTIEQAAETAGETGD